ncbi:hypothetical protein [Anabaena sp. CA = ATCC 33047]|uniref:hypothetical protein n=1 Tax=Anabaena sp. (strain CA / ATCC 33047) TaxID=52271 RepID=UPI000836966D|nr:hypothetical protein [Anabaena sp. CA = ATCC 33047]
MNLVNKLSLASAGIAMTLSIASIKPVQAVELASTTVINFDDLTNSEAHIPNGYNRLKWDNFYMLNTVNYVYASGYKNGTVSQRNIAYNAWAKPATISGISGNTFNFNSVYLTAAWKNGLNILVEGFTKGNLSYSQIVTVDSITPTQFVFNYLNVDRVRFSSFGGVQVPDYVGVGQHFALDNLSLTHISKPVPEPLTMGSTVVVLGLGFWMKCKKASVEMKR